MVFSLSVCFLEDKTIKSTKRTICAYDFKVAFKMFHNGEIIKGKELVKKGQEVKTMDLSDGARSTGSGLSVKCWV